MSTDKKQMSWVSSASPSTLQPESRPDEPACVANISPVERRKRLVGGLVGFVVSLAALATLVGMGANPWWRLGLFIPFFGAAVGFFQWRDKT